MRKYKDVYSHHSKILRNKLLKVKNKEQIIKKVEGQMKRMIKNILCIYLENLRYKNYYHKDFPFRIVDADFQEKKILESLNELK